MKQFLIFLSGMLAGTILLFAMGYRSEKAVKEKLGQQLIQTISNNLENLTQDQEVQYVEVKGKKGRVSIHTGMSKDSVQILVGKPDKVNLFTVGNSTHEIWGYTLKNDYLSDLDLAFKDGKLERIQQF